MKSRIPLIVAVVGALLVGGATTGSTRASWTDQVVQAGDGITAGNMSSAIGSQPTALPALARNDTGVETSTFTVTDSGAGKNLVQRLTSTITGTPTGVTAVVLPGATCASGGTSTAFIDKRPTDASHVTTFCVRVMPSLAAVSGDVTVNVTGRQHPSGWSALSTTLRIPVVINGFSLRCDGSPANNTVRLVWDSAGSGVTYTYGHHPTSSTGPFTTGPGTTTGLTIDQSWTGSVTRYYRISANTSPVKTTNILMVTRNASRDFTCSVVTP